MSDTTNRARFNHVSDNDQLLVVADDRAFVDVCRRACEVAFEGAFILSRTEALGATVRDAAPSMVIVHADGLADRGCSLVARVRARNGLEKIPVLAIGSRLGALDRWLLGAAGAFAVVIPSPTVDVVATVIEETLSYARAAIGVVESSRAASHLHIGCDHAGRLPVEAFLLLIAGAWSSGALPENALTALLDAARENDLPDDALRAIVCACEAPIPLVDVDVTDLADHDRCYLYAFALWIALGVGDVLPRFSPTLQVMSHTLGVTARLRPALQSIVERQRREGVSARSTFRREDFQHTLLPELEAVAGVSIAPPHPDGDEVLEMPDDALIEAL